MVDLHRKIIRWMQYLKTRKAINWDWGVMEFKMTVDWHLPFLPCHSFLPWSANKSVDVMLIQSASPEIMYHNVHMHSCKSPLIRRTNPLRSTKWISHKNDKLQFQVQGFIIFWLLLPTLPTNKLVNPSLRNNEKIKTLNEERKCDVMPLKACTKAIWALSRLVQR